MSEKTEVLWRRTGPPIVGDRVEPGVLLQECTQEAAPELHAKIERLRAEREALLADAERYRWLASRAHKDTARDRYGSGAHWRIGFFADDGRHTFDAAIDAAREKN